MLSHIWHSEVAILLDLLIFFSNQKEKPSHFQKVEKHCNDTRFSITFAFFNFFQLVLD